MPQNEQREYWRGLTSRSRTKVVVAIFCTFMSVGFASDLLDGLQRPFWWVLAVGSWFGLMSSMVGAVVLRRRTLPPVLILGLVLANIAILVLSARIPSNGVLTRPGFAMTRWRLALDATCWLGGTMAGYILLLKFITTEGVEHVRVRTELDLAAQLQHALAPPLTLQVAGYEIHGQCTSSSQMGGDVLDATSDSEGAVCYVADVSGHGIQAGVFMAMVKSSVRTALLHARPLGALLSDLNRVLFALNDYRLKGGRLLARLKVAAAVVWQSFIEARIARFFLVPRARSFAGAIQPDLLKGSPAQSRWD